MCSFWQKWNVMFTSYFNPPTHWGNPIPRSLTAWSSLSETVTEDCCVMALLISVTPHSYCCTVDKFVGTCPSSSMTMYLETLIIIITKSDNLSGEKWERGSENRGQRSNQVTTSDAEQNPQSTLLPCSTCWFLSNLKTIVLKSMLALLAAFSPMLADPSLHFFAHYCHLFISGIFLNPLVLTCSSTPTPVKFPGLLAPLNSSKGLFR